MPIRKGKRTAQRIKRIREVFAAARDGAGEPAKVGSSGWNNVEAYLAFDNFNKAFDQFLNFVQWEK
jgi:hypothetical protein